ncbi:hypothetical protein [Microbacterium sp. IEGM 1404]|uniref:hypothetical protein n=1 Tax=Microbacterium sp. IEGM 1404 TaxID=3047084 RepID=UPI0024B7F050|nr:hypothetical protein [Microbacterium sp. IEGM 1404]MDI9890908.1 hypothetical protein [Microbacterium sp. IEGM 1404]
MTVRRRPLTVDQVEVARTLHEHGHPIAAIATHLDTSYNNVRQRLIKEGVQLRPPLNGDPPTPLVSESGQYCKALALREQQSGSA